MITGQAAETQKPVHVYILNYDHLGVIMWKPEALERILDVETKRLEKYENYKVAWDHEAFAYDELAEKQPVLFEKMKQALNRFKGRLGIGTCTYGQPLSTFINEESNIRQLTAAIDTLQEKFGKTPEIYIMSEHAFHSQLPQLLAGTGFKGALLRTHFMMYGSNPGINAPVVRWAGLDGTRLPAVPTYLGQAVFAGREHQPLGEDELKFEAVTFDNKILTDSPDRYPSSLEAFRERHGAAVSPLVASRADDPRQLEGVVGLHQDRELYTWALGEEILEVLPEPAAEFPTGPNSFRVRMPWGFCGNWIWNRSREAERKLLTAERLCVFAGLQGGSDHSEELVKAWKRLLTGQHHDIQIVGIEEDAHTYLDSAVEISDRLILESMAVLSRKTNLAGEGGWTVFNPLQWDRTDWIGTEDGFTGHVPGLGFAGFEPGTGTLSPKGSFNWDPGTRTLKTRYYQVVFGENGGIYKMTDITCSRELLRTDKQSGILAGEIDGRECKSSGRIIVNIEKERVVVTETGFVGTVEYQMTWFFYDQLERIEWRCILHTHREKIGQTSEDRGDNVSAFLHEKKLRLQFYPQLSGKAAAIRDLPFAVAETPDRYIGGNYWTALSDGAQGLALFNRGLMGSIREEDGAFSVPIAFSMYYVWDGCFDGIQVGDGEVSSMTQGSKQDGPHFMQGTYTYELGILPFSGSWKDAGLHRQALEYNFPCVAVRSGSTRRLAVKEWSPLRIDGEQGVMSALFQKNGRIFARFYEIQGETAHISIRWNGKKVDINPTDMLGNTSGEAGEELLLSPWQIRTVDITKGMMAVDNSEKYKTVGSK